MNKNKFEFSPIKKALGVTLMSSLGLSLMPLSQVAAAENETADDAEDTKIIITGSRIRRDGADNAEPVEIISAADAKLQGIDSLAELLRQSTLASGSAQVTAATSTAFVQNGGTGSDTLSLRGLGANRTLVLLNGRRAGPSGTQGGVSSFDLNVIPLSAIERVEILKDGASSLYGSDAVAGVVNIITKQDDAASLDFFTSMPEESGGEQFRLSGTWGKSFERGSLMLTADYTTQKELAKGDRKFFDCAARYIFDETSGERVDPIDPRTDKAHCNDLLWGHVWLYDYQDAGGNIPGRPSHQAQYDYEGFGFPGYAADPTNQDFITTPAGWYPVNYDRASDGVANADHPFQDETSLIPEVEKMTLFAQGDFEITDDLTLYGEALFNRRNTVANGYRQFWTYVYNENFNPFAGGFIGEGNSLATGWTGAQWLSPTAITDISDTEINVDYTRFVTGLTGDIGNSDWYFDLSVQISRSDGDYINDVLYTDSVDPSVFASGSCVGTTTSVRGVSCVDVPWLDPQFLAGNMSNEVRDFLFGKEKGNTVYDQQAIEGVVSGTAYEMPAGPLDLAVGFHYRTDKIKDVPGETTRADNAYLTSVAGITEGKNTTKALFGEAVIPLLSDLPLAESVELKVSARYTDVSSFGDDTTFKVGLNWDVAEGVRIRASRGTSFRSPALFELYLADQTGSVRQQNIDPCINWGDSLDTGGITQRQADNCASEGFADDFTGGAISATVISGGGDGVLEAETSISETFGIVWTPDFADLAISLDRFDFKINGEVTQLGAATIVGRCYDSEFFPTDPLCDQFIRDPLDNKIDNVDDSFLNIASQVNRGYDLSINYATDLDIGQLRIQTKHTYQEEDSTELFPDTVRDTNGEFGDPRLTASMRATLSVDDWTYNWTVNYLGSVSNVERDGGDTVTYRGETVRVVNTDDETFYHALSVSHEFTDGLQAVFGMSNVFDTRPPQITTIGTYSATSGQTQGDSAFYSQYDWRGRRIFLNVSYQL